MSKYLSLVNLAVIGAVVSAAAHAQATMTSTSELKNACETSLGNMVRIDGSTSIQSGVPIGVPIANFETVRTNCTIVLGPSSGFKFDSAAMNFLGALNVVSATGNQLEFDKSNVYAKAIALNLMGEGSALFVKESNVRAVAGDTTVAFGHGAKLEMGGNSVTYGRLLEASNVVRMTAGNKFTASLSQGYIWGVNGVDINLTGEESVYKFSQFNTHAQPGRVSFRASGAKSTFEFGSGSIWGYSGISVAMTGVENQLISSGTTGFNTLLGAGVNIAVGNNQDKGVVKMSQARFGGVGGLVIQAGKGGTGGLIEFTQGSVIGMDTIGVNFETGEGGITIVKDSTFQPYRAPVTIKGPSLCLAENNVISASAQNLCR